MDPLFNQSRITVCTIAVICTAWLATLPMLASAAKPAGQYMAGDFHNHTTCSDGSISMQKLVKKVTDRTDTPWGLDWFVQAGHGGSGNRNCTLAEDETLATPAYPLVVSPTGARQGPTTTWQNTNPPVRPKGLANGASPNQAMWRWQSIQELQYPLIEYLSAFKGVPLFVGIESMVAGHEHGTMSVITGQMPASLANVALPPTAGYNPLGNATALAQWEYCFDRGDTDTSRGNATIGGAVGNHWDCAVPGSANAGDASWNETARKLMPVGTIGVGTRGHSKTVEGLKWMVANHPDGSYYVPAHLERGGPFNPDGNNGYNIEHLRDFNNAAPRVAFGFETQPGHHASAARGDYGARRNDIGGVPTDSVGGTTYGGTGVYGAQIGGVWDALLGEGRNWWFFASSDWHNRGSFGPDDRRSTQDFYPGEYQRTSVLARNGSARLSPQTIVDALRSGNAYSTTGQLIDRLAFVACASYPGRAARSNAAVEALATAAATHNTDTDVNGCATMGEKLVVRKGAEIVVSIVVRDPAGKNYSPYSFPNPSLLQVGIHQPLDEPALDHIDLIRGMVSGYRTPGTAGYAGEWPRNTSWLKDDGTTADLSAVPAAAKNTTAAVIKTFSATDTVPWARAASSLHNKEFIKMTYRVPAVAASQYLRLRGTNLPASVPYETDPSGNPLPDVFTNASNPDRLRIKCTTTAADMPAVGATYTGTAIAGCPSHLPTNAAGDKMVAYDVAAWSDLWFYSNPIFVEVTGSVAVAGVK
ncbi:MAG: hypothetical protein JWQ11_3026 [Rhizobacter sp.]|nr:hypothetical protein [Rhizobacter sp.]